jgi:predicted TPR repeat methyltransferase
MKYQIPVFVKSVGFVEIEAESLEEAIEGVLAGDNVPDRTEDLEGLELDEKTLDEAYDRATGKSRVDLEFEEFQEDQKHAGWDWDDNEDDSE